MWGDFQVPGQNVQFGHDTFVFGPHNGNDIITGYQRGFDTIEIDVPTQGAASFRSKQETSILRWWTTLTTPSTLSSTLTTTIA
jgi:hypothetical protein